MSAAPRTLAFVEHPLVRLLSFVLALGYLGLPGVVPPVPVTGADWLVALVSATLVVLGRWAPLGVVLAQSALLLASVWWSLAAANPVQMLLVVSLADVAFRRRGWPLALAVGVTVAAISVKLLGSVGTTGDALTLLFQLGVNVGIPLLVGGYMRLLRQAAVEADRHVAEVELRQETETRAARAAERTAIARELHDLIAHHVASIALRASTARHVAAQEPEVARALEDIRATAANTLSELRGLLAVLRDPRVVDADATVALMDANDFGVALDALIDRTRQAGLSVESEVDPQIHTLDLVRRGALVRVVQEALTNATKHAGPGARVTLEITLDGNLVRIDIANTGGNSDARPHELPSGHGLLGMRERIQLLGGTLVAGAEPAGWRVHATFPATAEMSRQS
ncbi:sensor histidine kinase [Streptoalloteichus hindustanus]|uniref:sensor histidine kinase n=1 Tax=Streptoalloteichus hindustanus TaxID=2017 RepID=UPI00135632F6|nr:histidine kinase [Streptoalloteichus hindustanus]